MPDSEPPPSLAKQTRSWWIMPVLIGLVITGIVLLLGDFRPMMERFYSVF